MDYHSIVHVSACRKYQEYVFIASASLHLSIANQDAPLVFSILPLSVVDDFKCSNVL